jgi:hypothetical protein
MAKLTKKQLLVQKKQLEKKLEAINSKIEILEKPNPIGFNYKNRVV